jgi:hypothetical protein
VGFPSEARVFSNPRHARLHHNVSEMMPESQISKEGLEAALALKPGRAKALGGHCECLRNKPRVLSSPALAPPSFRQQLNGTSSIGIRFLAWLFRARTHITNQSRSFGECILTSQPLDLSLETKTKGVSQRKLRVGHGIMVRFMPSSFLTIIQ